MADKDREPDETDETEEETDAPDAKVSVEETESSRAKTSVLRATSEADFIDERGPAAFVAEFIGTFFLVMFICGAAVLYGLYLIIPFFHQ